MPWSLAGRGTERRLSGGAIQRGITPGDMGADPTRSTDDRGTFAPPDMETAALQAELERLMAASTAAGLRGYDQVVRLYDAAFEALFRRYRERLDAERERLERLHDAMRRLEMAHLWQSAELQAWWNGDRPAEQPREA